MILMIAGIALAVAVFTLVKQLTVFGETCYHIGTMGNAATTCFSPAIYYGALGLAAVLFVIGLTQVIRAASADRTPRH